MTNKRVYQLVVLFIISFVIRMITYDSIFVGDRVRFLEFDPYYHMRRAVTFAQNFPHTWSFDSFMNFPYGETVGWPIIYDWTIALISNIIGFGNPSRHLTEIVGAYFPVFLGSLSVIVIFFVAKEIFDNWDENGEFKNIRRTKKTKIKHQAYEKIKINGTWKSLKSEQIGLISGLFLALIPAFVQVSFLGFADHHVAEVLLSTTIYLFFLKTLKTQDIRVRYKFLALTILVIILAIYTWPGTPIFIGIILIYLMFQFAIDKRYKHVFLIIGGLLVFYIVTYFIFPDVNNQLNSGVGFLFKERIVLQQVQETQPLFFTYAGKFNITPSWYAFNTAMYIALIGFILFIMEIIKNRKGGKSIIGLDREKIFFLVWTIIVLILNLYQTRFAYLSSVNIVILCAYLITKLINSNINYFKMLGFIFVTIIIVPSIQTDIILAKYPLMLSNDWFTSSEWLKNNTPDPNGNWNMPSRDKMPDYGIMSWWDYGHHILYLSERPVVANNFQLGAEESAKFYSSENESDANQILNERRVKYVVVDYRIGLNLVKDGGQTFLRGTWVSVAFLSGKPLSYYLDNRGLPNDKYMSTMYARLYLLDGKGLGNYKLIYKSDTRYPDLFNKPIEEIKIFEYRQN